MGMYNRKDFAKHKIGDKVKPKLHTGEGRTKQEFANESDINMIMKRYRATGQLPIGADPAKMVFADVSQIGSFAETIERVHAAEEAFAALPAHIRVRFENDPVQLVEFVQNGDNYDEAVKLGLIEIKEEPKVPTPAPKAPETPKA